MGSRIEQYLIGALLTTNRQAQFYAAIEADTERRVIIEEFLPYVTMGRVSGHEETTVVKHPESVAEAKKLFLGSRQNRCLPLIKAFEYNDTVYRAYDAGEGNLSELAEQLADDPILFRDGVGRPQMSITGIPFPAMPETRDYRGSWHKARDEKESGFLEENDCGFGRAGPGDWNLGSDKTGKRLESVSVFIPEGKRDICNRRTGGSSGYSAGRII